MLNTCGAVDIKITAISSEGTANYNHEIIDSFSRIDRIDCLNTDATDGTFLTAGAESQFTVEEAYEFLHSAAAAPGLQPRINTKLVDDFCTRFTKYIVGTKRASPNLSVAKEKGLRIVKIRKSSHMALSVVSFHVYRNPYLYRKVASEVANFVIGSVDRYLTYNFEDANLSLGEMIDDLKRGICTSDDLVFRAAAELYGVDFVLHSSTKDLDSRVRCPLVAK
ncbi:hypothetical protein ACOME3_004665 [Neoechinorhynchus agilis]